MAKKKQADAAPAGPASPEGPPASVAGYFRTLFKENPKLLKETSNQKLLDRWQADHPGQAVTKSIRNNLANLKSVLRSKKRKRTGGRPAETTGGANQGRAATRSRGGNALEALEQQIDECLTLARTEDREGLESVISLLRRARNAVVWKMGQ